MTRLILYFTVASCFVGCSVFGPGNVSEDNWSRTFSATYCNQLQKCQRGLFESEYSDLEDCKDEVEEALENAAEEAEDADCDFEEAEAQDCIDSLHASDCDDFFEQDYLEDCNEVFDCTRTSSDSG